MTKMTNKYIQFRVHIFENYEINTKYRISDEDSQYYYLGNNKISKKDEGNLYVTGEIV